MLIQLRPLSHRNQRRLARRLKDESGTHGGAVSTPAVVDNSGGNTTPAGSESQQQNNGGQSFDLTRFWDSPVEAAKSDAPPGGSAVTTPAPAGQQQQNPPTNPTVAAIQGMSFGNNVMTETVMKDLADGKTDSFHTAMNTYGQQVAEQTIRTILPIMSQLRDQLRSEMRTEVSGTLTNRDNMADLFRAIPSADTPATRPQVIPIFERAMTHTKGDRKAAIEMTKDMLRLAATSMGGDLGIPPKSAGDGTATVPSNTDWLAELAGR